jgi:hypothetical protein
VFSGIFTAEEVYGVGDQGSRDTSAVMYLEVLLNMTLKSVSFIDEAFFQ